MILRSAIAALCLLVPAYGQQTRTPSPTEIRLTELLALREWADRGIRQDEVLEQGRQQKAADQSLDLFTRQDVFLAQGRQQAQANSSFNLFMRQETARARGRLIARAMGIGAMPLMADAIAGDADLWTSILLETQPSPYTAGDFAIRRALDLLSQGQPLPPQLRATLVAVAGAKARREAMKALQRGRGN